MVEVKNDVGARLRFAWHLGRMVAGSARPGRYGDVALELGWLEGQGVKTIINLCSALFVPPDGLAPSFELVHLPVADCHPPTREQARRVIDLTRERISQDRAVLIHCRGGVGRTATVLTPVLMELGRLSLEQAVAELRRAGRLTQSMEQWRFLEEWSKAPHPGI